jgi:hypothetical protein
LPGKDHDAERRCPREREVPGSMIGPLPMGADRFATVSSGRSFAQVAGAILRKQARGQNPDEDAVARGRRSCYAS